jgi:trimethylamine---corrinoid protein Co-methyltransferase
MVTTRANQIDNITPRFKLLSDDQKDELYVGMIKTLSQTGANVHHEEARDVLKEAGAHVDGVRVFIPPQLVRDALQSVPPSTTLYNWEGDESCRIEIGRSYFGPGPTPPYFIDPETMERRLYLRKDAAMVARVCDALPNIGYVDSLGSISDVTNGLADLYEHADQIQNTTKPLMSWAFNVDNCRDEHRIGMVLAGGEEDFARRPNFIHYGEPISPLVSDQHAMSKCVYCAKHRVPQVYTPCSIGGATVPASHAGQIVVGLSEAMVGVVVAQLINPGTCVVIGGVQSILDMRSSVYSYGAPELALLSAGLTEMVHYCGLPMFSTSGCTDAKVLETQSGLDATLSIHAAMLTGATFVHDNGYTEAGKTGSIFQTVLADEVIGMARVIQKGIVVNDDTLAVEQIQSVGPGGHYLYEDHTLEHAREHWRPTLMDRNSYEGWEESGKPTMGERIVKKTRDLIENYEGPASRVPAEAKKEIDKILAEAEDRVARQGS